MKIDAHQHFWPYDPQVLAWISDEMAALRRDFLPEDLLPELEKNGYGGCVAVQAAQTEEDTEFLLNLSGRYPFIKGVVGWVDLRAANISERLTHFKQHSRFVGVRHVVQSELDDQFLLQPDFLRGIKQLEAFRLTYDLLIYPKHLPVATQFVAQFPNQPFVVDHLAKPSIKDKFLQPWTKDIWGLAAYENVFCKLSGMVTETNWHHWKTDDFISYLDVALEAFGASRLMIGSDWPVCTVAGSYADVMQIVEQYVSQLSSDEQAQILGQNAERFYGLK